METKLLFTINSKYIFVLDLLNICLLYNIRVNISVHNVQFFFFFQKMASFNPLAMILNQKPLDGNNFEDWKMNLYIVLD